jgi:hypothetical protein
LAAAGNDASLTTTKNKNSFVIDSERLDANSNHSMSNFDTLCEPKVIELSKCDVLTNFQGDEAKLLDEFYGHLKDIFGVASVLNGGNAKSSQQCIDNTVKGIMQVDVSKPVTKSETEFCTPGCEGHVQDCAQPILYAIMAKMLLVLGRGKHVTCEQGILKLDNRVSRCVDFVATSAEEYLYAILPSMLGVPIEIKPITRKNSKVYELLLEAQRQVIGHLAK